MHVVGGDASINSVHQPQRRRPTTTGVYYLHSIILMFIKKGH